MSDDQRNLSALPLEAARKRAEDVRQWADLNGGYLDWVVDDPDVREAFEKALWLAPDVERLADDLKEALALLTEAYPGDSPTNRWRERVEKLGAWPVKS